MQIEQSILIIRKYQDQNGISGLLETVEEMWNSRNDLTFHEAQAIRIFMDMGREMFAPKESV